MMEKKTYLVQFEVPYELGKHLQKRQGQFPHIEVFEQMHTINMLVRIQIKVEDDSANVFSPPAV
jgi:hypothetical protein